MELCTGRTNASPPGEPGCPRPHHELLPLSRVSDDDPLDLLVQAFHAVPEARHRGLGDGDEDTLWDWSLERTKADEVYYVCSQGFYRGPVQS